LNGTSRQNGGGQQRCEEDFHVIPEEGDSYKLCSEHILLRRNVRWEIFNDLCTFPNILNMIALTMLFSWLVQSVVAYFQSVEQDLNQFLVATYTAAARHRSM